ncbi:MAG: hypothetical protein AAGF12_02100 [Myxococcota bacterium]
MRGSFFNRTLLRARLPQTRRWIGAGWLIGALGIAAFGSVPVALADAQLDAARVRAENADFPGALELLEEVERSSELTRVELLRFLEVRAFVRFALGEREAAEQDLRSLAHLEPTYRLPENWSPDLIELFEAARTRAPAPPDVRSSATPADGTISIEASVERAPEHLRSDLVVLFRLDRSDWERRAGAEAAISVPEGAVVEYRAVLEGLGSAPIAQSEIGEYLRPTSGEPPPLPEESGSSVGLIVGLSVGAAVVAAAAVILVLLLTSDDGATRPDAPVVLDF